MGIDIAFLDPAAIHFFNIIFTLHNCRDLEQEIIGAAAKLGKIKPVDLVVKGCAAIVKSVHPPGWSGIYADYCNSPPGKQQVTASFPDPDVDSLTRCC
jgi:hypothetical protein